MKKTMTARLQFFFKFEGLHGHAHILTQITVACTAARHCCQENLVLGYDDHE
jgi:hypothetical protein